MCMCACSWEELVPKGHSHRLIIISAFRTQRGDAVRSIGSTLTAIIVARPHQAGPFKPGSINIYEQASITPQIVCGFLSFF